MVTLTKAAKKELDAHFAKEEKKPIRLYLAAG